MITAASVELRIKKYWFFESQRGTEEPASTLPKAKSLLRQKYVDDLLITRFSAGWSEGAFLYNKTRKLDNISAVLCVFNQFRFSLFLLPKHVTPWIQQD
jgi:hypothetical protein